MKYKRPTTNPERPVKECIEMLSKLIEILHEEAALAGTMTSSAFYICPPDSPDEELHMVTVQLDDSSASAMLSCLIHSRIMSFEHGAYACLSTREVTGVITETGAKAERIMAEFGPGINEHPDACRYVTFTLETRGQMLVSAARLEEGRFNLKDALALEEISRDAWNTFITSPALPYNASLESARQQAARDERERLRRMEERMLDRERRAED